MDLSSLPLVAVVAVFGVAAAAIAFAGTKLAHVADALADRTGMGEILAGAVFVGGSTSLPGIITSVVTAAQDYPGLAIGNAIGGLLAQTTFLAVADLTYRKANIEHAGASVIGLAQATLLVTMLTVPLLAVAGPSMTVWHIHPASIVLFAIYAFGLRLLVRIKEQPMWSPVETELTQSVIEKRAPTDRDRRSNQRLWTLFAVYAAITATAGYAIGEASIGLVRATGLSETAVGMIFTAISNSLPELVTAIAAVRIGAVNLAVGDIIGGNTFEVLFLAAADFAYTDGTIYDQFSRQDTFSTVLVILMTGILILGMLRREARGVANIGWESALVLCLYAGSVALILI